MRISPLPVCRSSVENTHLLKKKGGGKKSEGKTNANSVAQVPAGGKGFVLLTVAAFPEFTVYLFSSAIFCVGPLRQV